MSSYPTAATSTTRSSTSCSSRREAGSSSSAARPPSPVSRPPSPAPRPPSPSVAVIACGALGGHIREITARRGWPVEVHSLPSLLHNHPERIAPAAERLARDLRARGLRVALGYADCGSYGALDELCERLSLRRLPGLHCYDVLAGPDRLRGMFEREPGTYLLTDFLVRSFRRSVLAELGLDSRPELWPDYFGHYRRVVWLAQSRRAALDAEAAAVAEVFGSLAARLVRHAAHLGDIAARLTACGVDDVFVPAGDADPPAGRFDSALMLLDRLAEMGSPFSRVGVTGYPESHPKIDDDVTIQAMWDKRHHATYLVSNLCFNPATLRKWISRVRARRVTLPLFVGIAGPVDRARLVRMAAKAGVAESARFLAGHTAWLLRLGTPAGYNPERLLEQTGATLAAPGSAVEGLHVFTFNQVRQAEQWRREVLERLAERKGVSAV